MSSSRKGNASLSRPLSAFLTACRNERGRVPFSPGFTLVELLVAAAIFSMLALAAFGIVATVTRVWGDMRSRSEAYRRLDLVSEAIISDLRAVLSDNLGLIDETSLTRFLSYPDEAGNHVLAFTRSFGLGAERSEYLTVPEGGQYFTYQGKPKSLQAPDGIAEVVYFVRSGTLYRALSAPARGSFEDLIDPGKAAVISPGILRFSLRFWGPDTSMWEPPPSGGLKGLPALSLPLAVWDSTRGLGGAFGVFPYAAGPLSLADAQDDVFPHGVEVNLVVDGGRARTVLLRDAVGTGSVILHTSPTDGIPAPDVYPYLYIDGEWLRYSSKEKNGFLVERGVLGSKAASHAAGALVRWGYPAAFRVYVPAGKDAYDTGPEAR
jgi:prepilin-type N-terminal cleavage/methylation domain-containing protein